MSVSYTDYVHIAASQTNAPLAGPGGGVIGDILEQLILIPTSHVLGAIDLKDGTAGTNQNLFVGAVGSAAFMVEFYPSLLELPRISKAAGGWIITTGPGITVLAIGRFQ